MKFTIHQTELNEALQHLVRNTNTKFFTDIRMETKTDKLILQATNGEVSIKYILTVDSDTDDVILINARKFTDIVSRLSKRITFDNGVIKSGRSKLKIEPTQNDGRPFFTPISSEAITFTADDLKEFQTGIKNRLFVCDTLATNVLSGICLNKDEIAACNGNLLTVYKLSKQLPFDTVILSNKLCREVLKCFDNEDIKISMSNNKIMFQSNKISVVGLLLQGQYPQYKQLIPQPETRVTIDKTDIIKAIELLKLIDDKTCDFNFTQDKLIIVNKDSEIDLDVDYSKQDISIRFNSNYMINCLKNIDGDIIEFGFTGSLLPMLMTTDKETTLLMPIQKR